MKKNYIITVMIALVAVTMATVFFIVKNNLPTGPNTDTSGKSGVNVDTESYNQALVHKSEAGAPLMPTDIAGVYYTISTDGSVAFYSMSENGPAAIEATGSATLTVTCSDQPLTATVHYLRQDGVLTGYGLFRADSNAGVLIYEYALFKVTNAPAISSVPSAYKKDSSAILLIDTDKEDFYNNYKIYEESFLADLGTGENTPFLYVKNRTQDERGAGRADFAVLTDDVVDNRKGSSLLFFSSRHYHLYDNQKKMDIFKTGGSGSNKDNNRYIQNVLGHYAVNADGGVRYLAASDDGSTVQVKLYSGNDSKVLYEFPGSYHDDYLRDGDYLLNKKTNTVYSAVTGAALALNISDSTFAAELFTVSADGKSVFLRGKASDVSGVVLAKTSEQGDAYESRLFYNNSFKYLSEMSITGDGLYVCTVSDNEQGGKYTLFVFK